jgi:hypothetical protein
VTYVEYYLLPRNDNRVHTLFTLTLPPDQIGIFKFVPNIFESERPSPPEIWTLGDPRRREPHHFVFISLSFPGTWN